MNRPLPDHAEQSSADIWTAVGISAREAMARAGVAPESVRGIAFDATCSTVCLDAQGVPVCVSTSGEPQWDIIVWLDHRAVAEAEECTATGHKVLDFIGGVMSPEMATPKLAWLKRRLPASWERLGMAFDLADFLSWKASGSLERSECTVTCKWTYLAHETPGWQQDFFAGMGLGDLIVRGALPARAVPSAATSGHSCPKPPPISA